MQSTRVAQAAPCTALCGARPTASARGISARAQPRSLQAARPPARAAAARRVVAAAVAEAPGASSCAQDTVRAGAGLVNQHRQWYALVASAEFYFNDVQNEALAEQLREKVRFYGEQGMDVDFYFAVEPTWLESKVPGADKRIRRPAVALVSPDKSWITFMKLRLDRVIKVELGEMSMQEAAGSTQAVPEFKTTAKWTAPYTPYASGWWEMFLLK